MGMHSDPKEYAMSESANTGGGTLGGGTSDAAGVAQGGTAPAGAGDAAGAAQPGQIGAPGDASGAGVPGSGPGGPDEAVAKNEQLAQGAEEAARLVDTSGRRSITEDAETK